MHRRSRISALALVLLLPGVAAAQDEGTFTLTILHTNDTHAHHAPNPAGDGGAAWQAAVVDQIRAEGGPVLLLDAGDRFAGTLFHQQYRGQDSVQVMNAIGYDGMTLGNHEFDDGDQVLADFIDGVEFPVVTANVDFRGSPALAGKVPPAAVIEVAGEQVGIIGLVTADTPIISNPGAGLIFDGDYAAVTQARVDDLTAQGVDKIVLVTHIGLADDIEVAATTRGVDLIVGGHSHSLLGNAYTASVAEYPVVVEDLDGMPVSIVQAGEHTEYLGRVDLTFDAAGVVTEVEGADGTFAEIDPAAVYTVATNDFMRRGSDGYEVLATNAIDPYDFGKPQDQVLGEYIRANSPVAPIVEGRITRVDAAG